MTPVNATVVAALIAAVVALITVIANIVGNWRIEERRAVAAERLQEVKSRADTDLAERRFAYDRALIAARRRVELAEGILGAAYQADLVLRHARGRGHFNGEGESRPGREADEEKVRKLRDTYYVVFERIQQRAEAFASLVSLSYQFTAYFGAEGAKAIDEILKVKNELQITAKLLIDLAGSFDYSMAQHSQSALMKDVYGSSEDGNTMDARLTQAVQSLEAMCRPVLADKPEAAFTPPVG